MDLNRNGIFDSLESLLDGRRTVDVFVDYDHVPTPEDVALLRDMGFTTAGVYRLGKAVGLNDVPSRLVRSLPGIPGVVMVEPAGTPLLFSDIATPNAKARPSEEYSPYTAWEMGVRGRGINIAVVDTGIDDAHPSLQGKFVAGVDFSKPEGPLHPRDGSFNPDDTNGHGTTCSGIATGTGAPDGVYTGAAPEAMLVDVRIGTMAGFAPGEIGQFPPNLYDATLEGIEWVAAHKDDIWPGAPESNQGIDILSLSWGINVRGSSDGSDIYSRTLDEVVMAGVFVSNAAGNSGPDNDGFDGLAAASLSIVVAASDDRDTINRSDDMIADYSSRGPRADDGDEYPYDELRPDVAAPGTGITQAEFD
ncbi:MAG: S8 family serine peptidase, partial [Thermoplasmata archaeon]|nr:S8 family serine peptidase [Thermoplasmata archaeon]